MNMCTLFIFLLYPKCPACWAAYATVFSTFGLGEIEYSPVWKIISLITFLASMVFINWKIISRKEWKSLILYSLGVSVFAFGYYTEPMSNWWLWVGASLFLSSMIIPRISKLASQKNSISCQKTNKAIKESSSF